MCCWLAALAAALAGCRGTGQVTPVEPAEVLAPAESLRLAGPAVDLCRDGDRLLVLEASGTRVLVLGADLRVVDTLVLTGRLAAPRGIGADRHYVFLYDDNTLYRMAKDREVLSVWQESLRVAGLASYAPGELLVSDARRGVVWRRPLSGESRLFLDVADVARPGALAALPEGLFAVLGGGGRLKVVNRAGIAEQALEVPGRLGRMCAAENGALYLYETGGRLVLAVRGGTRRFELQDLLGVTAMAAAGGRLVVIDNTTRILAYDLPDR